MRFPKKIVVSSLLIGVSYGDLVTVPHPDVELPSGKTVIWSHVFQACWDAMTQECGGVPVRINPPNELMTKLDSFRFDVKSVMPEDAWKVWAGPVNQEFLDRVNREARAIMGDGIEPFRTESQTQESVAAFGVLNRDIKYNQPLYRSRANGMEFAAPAGPMNCQFFGVTGELSAEYGDNIRVLAYQPEKKSHAIEVLCEKGHESVIFYLPQGELNFSSACTEIRSLRNRYQKNHELWGKINDPKLHQNDSLRVPYVRLQIKSTFPELFNSLRYSANKVDPWHIVQAEQITHFDLDESGARVKVQVSTEADPFGAPPTVPRDFIYDRPFFVFLWKEKAEWPYFGVWIGDASALQPFK